MMPEPFHVFVPGPCKPQRRGHISTKGRNGRPLSYPVLYAHGATRVEQSRVKAYLHKEVVQSMYHSQMPLRCPVALFAILWFKLGKSISMSERLKRFFHTIDPDQVNVLKLIEDAANGVLWSDDDQIAIHIAMKLWSEDQEGYELWVHPIDPSTPESTVLSIQNVKLLFSEACSKISEAWLDRTWDPCRTVPLVSTLLQGEQHK